MNSQNSPLIILSPKPILEKSQKTDNEEDIIRRTINLDNARDGMTSPQTQPVTLRGDVMSIEEKDIENTEERVKIVKTIDASKDTKESNSPSLFKNSP